MSEQRSRRVVVTGATGLLGFHARALLEARNGERRFAGEPPAFDVVALSHADFDDPDALARALTGADIVLHLAGVNRAAPDEVERGNTEIARTLVGALRACDVTPCLVFANSTHIDADSAYGRGKRAASALIERWATERAARYVDVVLPHVFGEGGVPFYNTVTATLIHQAIHDETPRIAPGAAVELLHAGDVAELMLDLALSDRVGEIRPSGTKLDVTELHDRIRSLHASFDDDVYPGLDDALTRQLYNAYRFARFPQRHPRALKVNADARGQLFEASKGGGGGQSFLSWTHPEIERGNHFHRHKVERFVVLKGVAEIRLRRIFDTRVHRFAVSGDDPVAVDMPTLHAHSIVNTGDEPLLTLFWAHEVFDRKHPDTFMYPVLDFEAVPR